MRSFIFFVIACVIILPAALVSGQQWTGLGKRFGKKLCENMDTTASHSQLLEKMGNRTTCVVSVTDKVVYTTDVATVIPLQETSFKIENLGTLELKLTGECELDPCYKVISSPGDKFNGNYVFNSPGMVDNKLAFIAVYDCKNGEQRSQRGGFYDASPEIVKEANKNYGFGVTLDELKQCVEKAKQAGEGSSSSEE